MADPVITRILESADDLETISSADLAATYRDALRGKETDYARRLALPEDYGDEAQREVQITRFEAQIERLRELVTIFDEKAAAEAEAIAPPPPEPPPAEEPETDDAN